MFAKMKMQMKYTLVAGDDFLLNKTLHSTALLQSTQTISLLSIQLYKFKLPSLPFMNGLD